LNSGRANWLREGQPKEDRDKLKTRSDFGMAGTLLKDLGVRKRKGMTTRWRYARGSGERLPVEVATGKRIEVKEWEKATVRGGDEKNSRA